MQQFILKTRITLTKHTIKGCTIFLYYLLQLLAGGKNMQLEKKKKELKKVNTFILSSVMITRKMCAVPTKDKEEMKTKIIRINKNPRGSWDADAIEWQPLFITTGGRNSTVVLKLLQGEQILQMQIKIKIHSKNGSGS